MSDEDIDWIALKFLMRENDEDYIYADKEAMRDLDKLLLNDARHHARRP